MTAAIVLALSLLAILIGAIWIVRHELRKPDFDYCDTAASEPMPMEPERRRVRAGDVA